MSFESLFSIESDRFIEELKNQKPDYLSFEVARKLDAASCLVPAEQKLERLTLYLNAQLQHYLDDKIVLPLNLNKGDSTVRIQFTSTQEVSYLKQYLKLTGYQIDIAQADLAKADIATADSIKLTMNRDYATFFKICKFVKQLQFELSKKAVNMPLLADSGLFSDKPIEASMIPSNQASAAPKAKL